MKDFMIGCNFGDSKQGTDMLINFDEDSLAKDLDALVSILTGWMSGRQFYPPALESRNLITDPLTLMFEEKFVRGFVTYTRDLPNIRRL